MFRSSPKKSEGVPSFIYRKISNPARPEDSQLRNAPDQTSINDLYNKLKNAGIMSNKLGEGAQKSKATGLIEPNDLSKHIKDSKGLYKEPTKASSTQIRVHSIKFYPHGKEAGENDAFV